MIQAAKIIGTVLVITGSVAIGLAETAWVGLAKIAWVGLAKIAGVALARAITWFAFSEAEATFYIFAQGQQFKKKIFFLATLQNDFDNLVCNIYKALFSISNRKIFTFIMVITILVLLTSSYVLLSSTSLNVLNLSLNIFIISSAFIGLCGFIFVYYYINYINTQFRFNHPYLHKIVHAMCTIAILVCFLIISTNLFDLSDNILKMANGSDNQQGPSGSGGNPNQNPNPNPNPNRGPNPNSHVTPVNLGKRRLDSYNDDGDDAHDNKRTRTATDNDGNSSVDAHDDNDPNPNPHASSDNLGKRRRDSYNDDGDDAHDNKRTRTATDNDGNSTVDAHDGNSWVDTDDGTDLNDSDLDLLSKKYDKKLVEIKKTRSELSPYAEVLREEKGRNLTKQELKELHTKKVEVNQSTRHLLDKVLDMQEDESKQSENQKQFVQKYREEVEGVMESDDDFCETRAEHSIKYLERQERKINRMARRNAAAAAKKSRRAQRRMDANLSRGHDEQD